MATNYKLQLKRNNAPISGVTKEAAKAALNTALTSSLDGELLLGRYKYDENTYKTLLGFRIDGKNWIYDTDSIPAEVQASLDVLTTGVADAKGAAQTADGKAVEAKSAADAAQNAANAAQTDATQALADAATAQAAAEAASNKVDSEIQKLDSEVTDGGDFVTSVTQTNGKVSVVKSTPLGNTLKKESGVYNVNVDGTTITVSDDGVLSVAASATSVSGSNAISVSEAAGGGKQVSLTINSNDKVLSQDANGLLANLSLTWDKTAGLKLIGKDNAELATIPATDLIKDGMVDAVAYDPDTHKITITWNTDSGKTATELDVSDLVDTYTAGNGIAIANNIVSAKKANDSESFLTVDGDGIKISGVLDAIDAAAAAAKTQVQHATGNSHVTVTANTPAAGDPVVYTVNESDIASAALLGTVNDVATANTAFGKIAAEAARAADQEDVIEAAVGLNADGTFKAPTKGSASLKATTSTIGAIEQLADEMATLAAGNATVSAKDDSIVVDHTEGNPDYAVGVKLVAKSDDNKVYLTTTTEGVKIADDSIWDCGTF